MPIELKRLFSVPIVKFKFTKHYQYNFPSIEKSERIPDGWEISLNTSFPFTEEDDPYIDKDVNDRLREDLLDDISKTLMKLELPHNISMDQFWYNVYHDNQGQEPHDHTSGSGTPNCYWCGIYYHKGASSTLFHAPHRYMKTTIPSDTGPLMQSFYTDLHDQEVDDGDVILFPSYLVHEVRPNPTRNDMRLTFSFNIMENNE
tara:strand:+ start:11782 stop:12387 length:606 start_codon:yes stop_codon:yes gene_type:complete